jgi:hypothetical protein
MKITLEMSKGAYEIAKKVWEGDLTRNEAKIVIHEKTSMNEGSAFAFITIFLSMMQGEVYKRAFNNETNKFLFLNIRKDYGEEYFNNALNAAELHTKYYSTLGKGNLSGLETLIQELRQK